MPVCSSSFILFALLYRRHLKGNIGSEVPCQVWWGFLERQLLLNVITVRFSVFLSKEFQSEWATPHIPDVVVNQNFGTFEWKCNPLKFSWIPASPTKHGQKSICATAHMTSSARPHPWLRDSGPVELTHLTVNFRAIKLQGARIEPLVRCFFWETKVLETSFNVDLYKTSKQSLKKKKQKWIKISFVEKFPM